MYLNNWSNLDDMKGDFWPNWDDHKLGNELEGVNVLLASYGTPNYEGYAFVLFERGKKLYEVYGSHCSCYGLEGQWDPEETNVDALKHRVDEGELGEGGWDENPFSDELLKVLNAYSH